MMERTEELCTPADLERLKVLGLHGTLGDFVSGCWLVKDQYQMIGGTYGFGNTLKEAIDDWCVKHPAYSDLED
jgi:hypothetical protein